MTRVAPTVRDGVYGRDGLACTLCGKTYPLTLQHRRARGMGSTRRPETDLPANLVTLCGSGTTGCHGYVEANPDISRQRGYRVGQHTDPALVPIIWHGQWVWLADDFTVTPLGAGELADLDGGAA